MLRSRCRATSAFSVVMATAGLESFYTGGHFFLADIDTDINNVLAQDYLPVYIVAKQGPLAPIL